MDIVASVRNAAAVSHFTGAPIFSNYYSYVYHNSTSLTASPSKVYYPTGSNSIASPSIRQTAKHASINLPEKIIDQLF
jgi:hypothetical protein